MTVYLNGKNGYSDRVEKNVATVRIEDKPTGDEVIIIGLTEYSKRNYELVKIEA